MEPRQDPPEPSGSLQRWVTWLLVLAILGQLVWLTVRYAGRSPAGTSSAVGLESPGAPEEGLPTELEPPPPEGEPEPPVDEGGSEPPPPEPERDARSLLFGDRPDAPDRMETLAAVLVALQQGPAAPGLPAGQRRKLAEALRPYFAAAGAERTALLALLAPLSERQQERLLQAAAEPLEPMSVGRGLARLSEALRKRTGGRSRPLSGDPVPPELAEAMSADTLFLVLLGLEQKGMALSASQAEEVYGAVQAYERCRQEQERHEDALVALLTREQVLWLRANNPAQAPASAIPFLVEEWLHP